MMRISRKSSSGSRIILETILSEHSTQEYLASYAQSTYTWSLLTSFVSMIICWLRSIDPMLQAMSCSVSSCDLAALMYNSISIHTSCKACATSAMDNTNRSSLRL